jgi:predicted Zn-dependent protease with MMP-like domain
LTRTARWAHRVRIAEGAIAEVLSSLPGDLADEARALPVIFEPRPSRAMQAEGLEPDLLGLFVGIAHPDAQSGIQDLPAQILLFLDNLWQMARGDAVAFREEVRITYLHELGHYLGLGEDAIADRGLE